MLSYQFMVNAFEAGTIVAIVAGAIGYFVVLRGSSFAAHALSHIGFAGATGAIVLGLSPFFGLLAFTSAGGLAIGALGDRLRGRDVTIGIVLAWALGLGVLFISLYRGYATEAYALLFGQILGISSRDVVLSAIFALLTLSALLIVYRPLLFASVDEGLARAKGVPTTALGVVFMLILAVAVSEAVQVVGVLLIFALVVTPAAVSARLTNRPGRGIIIAVLISLGCTWVGLGTAYFSPHPVGFFVTSLAFAAYLAVRAGERLRSALRPRPAPAAPPG
ncbi:MAG TPA: metal ABC transporter permease [Candidatus Nitrosotalea sp.]|nr:metal ABC transporter permease [Candidatus Nitrosotalea sp.]